MRRFKKGFAVLLSAAIAVTSMLEPTGNTALAKKSAKTKKQAKSIQVKSPFSAKDKKVTTTLTLKKGSTFKIKTAVSPKAAGKKMVFKSSKKKVAAVSKAGKIKAKKVGKAKITVYPKDSKKVKAVIQVTVVKKFKKVKKIKLDKASLALSVKGNHSAQLKASVTSPKKPTVKKFNWFTSNKKVAVVNKTGVVTAKQAGNATITVTSADGRGAKAVCKVAVSEGTNPNPSQAPTKAPVPTKAPAPSKTPSVTSSAGPTGSNPGGTSSPTPIPVKELTVVVPGERTGVKQGESIQLVAAGPGADKVAWKVSELAGVTLSASGLLTVGADAKTNAVITITATTSADVAVKTAAKELTIVENKIKPLTADQILLNQNTKENPFGLTYRDAKACTTVQDAERGEVIRFDASKGYTSNANDMLAWMVVDSAYAGKTVTISGYFKYEAAADDLKDGVMNLIVNENWGHTNPAYKYNAEPGKWYYVTGKYILTSDMSGYSGNRNRLYIARSGDHLNAGKNAVYYMDGLRFTIEKPVISEVTLTAAGNATTVYQNNTLQFTPEVKGTNGPSQKVKYSIEPAVQGASIDDKGLLTVGNVPGNTKINVKAAAYEDETKFATKEITVLPQTIDSITVSAKENQTVIYAGKPVQFSAEVAVTGGTDKSVTWSVSPQTAGVTISDAGLLSVADTVAENTTLTVKATSKFDTKKSGQCEITVKANKVNTVTIKSAGDKTTVTSGLPLNLSADISVDGVASDKILWTIENNPAVAGASLAVSEGKNTILSVTSDVAVETSITVRATSEYDSTKYDEITVTVKGDSNEFNLNKLTVETWLDFNGLKNSADFEKYMQENAENITYTSTNVDGRVWHPIWWDNYGEYGVCEEGTVSDGLLVLLSQQSDNIQFSIENTTTEKKTYLVSFMTQFFSILTDSDDTEYPNKIDYQLPLKLVSVNEAGAETTLKTVKCPYSCDRYFYNNKEFHEIISTVEVPAGETLRLQLKVDGELPSCQVTEKEHSVASGRNEPHPVYVAIDNVAISSGEQNTLTLSKGETADLGIETIAGDTVKYFTNCKIAKDSHENEPTNCPNLGEETLVATVDENGTVTALNAGETILIAEITHEGVVERKQCIVHVNNE